MAQEARVVGVEEECGFRWLRLKKLAYVDQTGRRRFWEMAERTTRRGAVDGVGIVAVVRRRASAPQVVLVTQFRPPLDGHVLELPAGLVDGGEGAGGAALRELKEETGFVGTVASVSPVVASDPGMSAANMQLVVVDVDGDAPENLKPVAEPEEGEFITVLLVPLAGLAARLRAEMKARGYHVDARLYAYAAGLELAAAAPTDMTTKAAGDRVLARREVVRWLQARLRGTFLEDPRQREPPSPRKEDRGWRLPASRDRDDVREISTGNTMKRRHRHRRLLHDYRPGRKYDVEDELWLRHVVARRLDPERRVAHGRRRERREVRAHRALEEPEVVVARVVRLRRREAQAPAGAAAAVAGDALAAAVGHAVRRRLAREVLEQVHERARPRRRHAQLPELHRAVARARAPAARRRAEVPRLADDAPRDRAAPSGGEAQPPHRSRHHCIACTALHHEASTGLWRLCF